LHKEIKHLRTMTKEELVTQRIAKFAKLTRYNEV
jgi:acetyl-CoA carboxylase alpha subunit